VVRLIGLLVISGGVLAATIALLTPFYLLAVDQGRKSWRVAAATVGCYAITAVVLGFFAYALLPADYTKFHRPTLHPTASSLGEIHAVDLEPTRMAGAFTPLAAAARREEIRRERLTFARDWLRISMVGLALPTAILGARYLAHHRTRPA
jgi:hypothetical protein